ncbi:MAG: GyrI-like domain-containing protein [Cyclobacteriaceae bacterium]
MKYEWRKQEKDIYMPKNKPIVVDVTAYQFLTIAGEGNPNSEAFSEYISALFAVSYAIKMTLKKRTPPKGYMDYTVYPLEGVWDINEKAKKNFTGTINQDDLVFQLMIRQPDFVDAAFVKEMIELTIKKKPHPLLEEVQFEKITEGRCIQMMHVGSYDSESESFELMEAFATANHLSRASKLHREIYLSDFRKVAKEKLKTVLRFKVVDS